jgi:septal ring factor EnvC (AmiA/AmiB activator)
MTDINPPPPQKNTLPWILTVIVAVSLVVVAIVYGGKVRSLNTTVATVQAQLDESKGQTVNVQAQLDQAKKGSAQLQAQVDQANADKAQVETQAKDATAKVSDLQAKMDQALKQIAQLQSPPKKH